MLFPLLLSILVICITARSVTEDPFSDEKIVGGKTVNVEQYPYQVSILQDGGLWCGGSIISEFLILTAAHCVKRATKPLVVHAGSSFWKTDGSFHHVDYTVPYEFDVKADLILLHVQEQITFDNTRQPVKLALPDTIPPTGAMSVVTGWGDTKNTGSSIQLRAVQVPIVEHNQCDSVYRGIYKINDGEICAGFVRIGGKDACQGDSGGPLVLDGVQIGVVSKGLGCAKPNAPGIYVDVSYYSDWITEKISG